MRSWLKIRLFTCLSLLLVSGKIGFAQIVPPIILGQTPDPVIINEDQALEITTNHLVIVYLGVGQMQVKALAGSHYSVSGNSTITPELNYSGDLIVPVIVSAAGNDSEPYNFKIQVNPVNDAPQIIGQIADLTVNEDTPLNLLVSHFNVVDPDNDPLSLIILPGTNYSFSGSTLTPSLNYNGPLTVNVKVNDGTSDSNTFGTSVTVNAVNDPPQIVSQKESLSVNEDNTLALSTTHLNITDPDNNTFSLIISPGDNYTFSGNSVTPALNYVGTLNINVQVSDGTNSSNTFPLAVSVLAQNDPPVIQNQIATLSVNENESIVLSPEQLTIADPDDNVFSLIVLPGDDYTFSGATVTPAVNYSGPLLVNVQVSDGTNASNVFAVAITVSAQNDPPQIVSQKESLTVNEDNTIVLEPAHLNIIDSDNTTFTLIILAGTNYTFSETSITPSLNYFGPLSINVQVSDGTSLSNTFAMSVEVIAQNDAPVISNQKAALSVNEDNSIILETNHFTIIDPDNSSFTLTVLPGSNYTFSGTTITPVANYAGPITVDVQVNDGSANSNVFPVSITVVAQNDPPSIQSQNTTLSVNEDGSITLNPGYLNIIDPDNSTFTLIVLAGTNYTFSGTTVTPLPDYAGPLTVNVQVSDGTSTSNVFPLSIAVVGQNDPPQITSQKTTLTVNEDETLVIDPAHFNIIDNDNTTFTLIIVAGTNYTFAGSTLIPTPDYSGPLTVNIQVSDGTTLSNTFAAQVTVTPVNDPPQIVNQKNALNVNEGQSIALNVGHFTITDPDNTNFTLTILPGVDYTFSGTTVTPSAEYNGTLNVNIQVSDGVGSSNVFAAQITVLPVNNPPQIVGQAMTLNMNEDEQIVLDPSYLTIQDPDNSSFTLIVLNGSNYTFTGTTVKPALDYFGQLTVNVQVSDGTNNSSTFGLVVNVQPLNDPPQITGQNGTLSVNEDNAITLDVSQLIVKDVDNTTFVLSVLDGINYTYNGTIVTPSLNYAGPLTINVRVSDGASASNTYGLQVTVSPVNDPPKIIAQVVLSIDDDQSLTIVPAHLTIEDPDNTSGFVVTVLTGSNYTFSGNTITPVANFAGVLHVNITVSDGVTSSAVYDLIVNVDFTNDPPGSHGLPVVTITEDQVQEQKVNILNGFYDKEDTPELLTYTIVSNSHPEYFDMLSINNLKGELTFKIKPNVFGTVTITIRATDTGSLSVQDNLTISIEGINDSPSFNTIPTQQVVENSGQHTITITSISKGPFEDAQQLTLLATSGNTALVPNPVINYDGFSTTAQLVYTVLPNASGNVTITVFAVDNGLAVAPHQNSFTTSFQIEISDINNPPTLNAIANITIEEDAALLEIPLTGISAGPLEDQVLTVTAVTNRPELFEVFEVIYQSPQPSGILRIKPKPNAFGSSSVTVTVADNGNNVHPNVNSVSRSFTVGITPVNDLPTFVLDPITMATVGDLYEYRIETQDPDAGDPVTVTAPQKPAWLTLTSLGGNVFRLRGTPPMGSGGDHTIRLQAQDASGGIAVQEYTLVVNTKPQINPFTKSVNEDEALQFTYQDFSAVFTDADNHTLNKIKIVTGPKKGIILLGDQPIAALTEIIETSINQLRYIPEENYVGLDTIQWSASDGKAYSINIANILIEVKPVNDAPVITVLEEEVLEFRVGEGAMHISSSFDIIDVDDDSLVRAEISFRRQNFESDSDMLTFTETENINIKYDAVAGVLTMAGKAPIEEYREAIRGVKYEYITDVYLDNEILKSLSYTVSDGKQFSVARDRQLRLIDTFEELVIPEGFTPNSDTDNDAWIIDKIELIDPGKVLIKVFDARGKEVYSSTGYEQPWDGTFRGEPLPIATYYYYIDLNLERRKTYKGSVTILR